MKIVIASSKGGHLTQMLEFIHSINKQIFIVTDSLIEFSKEKKNINKITFFSLRSRSDFKNHFKNFLLSLIYSIKLKPDIVITNGSGVVLFFCIFSKMLGSKLIFIESISRVYTPSLFGRIIYYFSDKTFVQWKPLQKKYPKSQYAGILIDLRYNTKKSSVNRNKIFVTIGTRFEGFNRLIKYIDKYKEKNLKIDIFAQIGHSTEIPTNIQYKRFLPLNKFIKKIENSDIIITTNGAGNIFTALKYNKPIIVVMRDPKRNEVLVPNPDLAIHLSKLGVLYLVRTYSDLIKGIFYVHPSNFTISKYLIPTIINLLKKYDKKG